MATWNNQSKNAASFANQSKSGITDRFLLLEDGFFMLQEDGLSRLLIDTAIAWANQIRNAATWANQTKN